MPSVYEMFILHSNYRRSRSYSLVWKRSSQLRREWLSFLLVDRSRGCIAFLWPRMLLIYFFRWRLTGGSFNSLSKNWRKHRSLFVQTPIPRLTGFYTHSTNVPLGVCLIFPIPFSPPLYLPTGGLHDRVNIRNTADQHFLTEIGFFVWWHLGTCRIRSPSPIRLIPRLRIL